MLRYCPTCDRSSKDTRFVGEFCEVCVIKKLAKKLPNKARVTYCKRCERLKTSLGYVDFDDKALANVITRDVCGKDCTAKVKSLYGDVATVSFTFHVGEDEVQIDKKLEVEKNHLICQDCYRKSSGYYEALVQIRGNSNRVESMITKIRKFVTANAAFITKIEELDGGVDLYVSDKKVMNTFFLVTRINPTRSYTLYGKKGGTDVYRNIYALRL
jgi:NMD protein affecting ribosome stability and mRNA decay